MSDEIAKYYNELWNAKADLENAAGQLEACAEKMRAQALRISLIVDPPTKGSG